MHQILRRIGVIVGQDADGPVYDPQALCFAPEERVAVNGVWKLGLWPSWIASAEDNRQRDAFHALVEHWTHYVGADGLPAFSIPVALSSQDPEIRALAGISFQEWIEQQGFDSTVLRWWLEYGTRDDYGTLLSGTSAWAGLHYHCARRPWIGDARDIGTDVLTWPAGNGWIVKRLLERIDASWLRSSLVTGLDSNSGAVVGQQLFSVGEIRTFELQADAVILAVPSLVADRLLERNLQTVIESSPWVVANIHCNSAPRSLGAVLAWDNVIYGARSLGYVVNTHQDLRSRSGSTLSWYLPHCETDLRTARINAAAWGWDSLERLIIDELSSVHQDIEAQIESIDVHIWGHGTTRPVVGLHLGAHLLERQQRVGRVHLAHTDLSGVSLFEEAAYHGVRVAEEILGDTILETWL